MRVASTAKPTNDLVVGPGEVGPKVTIRSRCTGEVDYREAKVTFAKKFPPMVPMYMQGHAST